MHKGGAGCLGAALSPHRLVEDELLPLIMGFNRTIETLNKDVPSPARVSSPLWSYRESFFSRVRAATQARLRTEDLWSHEGTSLSQWTVEDGVSLLTASFVETKTNTRLQKEEGGQHFDPARLRKPAEPKEEQGSHKKENPATPK
jgi:hypothetical protein